MVESLATPTLCKVLNLPRYTNISGKEIFKVNNKVGKRFKEPVRKSKMPDPDEESEKTIEEEIMEIDHVIPPTPDSTFEIPSVEQIVNPYEDPEDYCPNEADFKDFKPDLVHSNLIRTFSTDRPVPVSRNYR